MKRRYYIVPIAIALAMALVPILRHARLNLDTSPKVENSRAARGALAARGARRADASAHLVARKQAAPTDEVTSSAIDAPTPSLLGCIIRSAPKTPAAAEPASDRTIALAPNERVTIELNRAALDPTRPVVLRADNGGLLNDRPLQPQVTLTPGDNAKTFSFRAGQDRGLYTVTVAQSDHRETLEFWVGREPPRGRPGPARQIVPPALLAADLR